MKVTIEIRHTPGASFAYQVYAKDNDELRGGYGDTPEDAKQDFIERNAKGIPTVIETIDIDL